MAFGEFMNELLGLGYNHSTEVERRIEQVTLEQVQDVGNTILWERQLRRSHLLPVFKN